MALVVHRIQELGVEVKHVLGGCTFLCQPISIGFSKPFKDCIWRLWSNPTRLNVATWVDQAMAEMKMEHKIVRNVWLKMGFE
jgi:hypothetical protein